MTYLFERPSIPVWERPSVAAKSLRPILLLTVFTFCVRAVILFSGTRLSCYSSRNMGMSQYLLYFAGPIIATRNFTSESPWKNKMTRLSRLELSEFNGLAARWNTNRGGNNFPGCLPRVRLLQAHWIEGLPPCTDHWRCDCFGTVDRSVSKSVLHLTSEDASMCGLAGKFHAPLEGLSASCRICLGSDGVP